MRPYIHPPSVDSGLAERQATEVGIATQLASQTGWYAPAQLVPLQPQPSQVGEVAQLRRYLPAQFVPAEVQLFQVGEVA